MLTYHQLGLVAYIWGQFRKRYLSHHSQKLAWKLQSKTKLKSSRGRWVNSLIHSYSKWLRLHFLNVAHRIRRDSDLLENPVCLGVPIICNSLFSSEICILRLAPFSLNHYRALLCDKSSRYSDTEWPPRLLSSPASQLFVRRVALADIKRNIKAPHHWLC